MAGARLSASPSAAVAVRRDDEPRSVGDGGPVLRLDGITKRFPGVVALDGVSFTVERGTIHGILGENGAGKSTLMNVIYGFLQPDAGTVHIRGANVELSGPRDSIALGIGMVHQHFMLVPDMTVTENVALGLASWRRPRIKLREVARRIAELSAADGLKVDPEARIDQLSVGEQQRVEIIKLLYRDAEIIVLDEPTAVLTGTEWNDLRSVLRDLADRGRTILFITHKLDEIIQVADRATVLRAGRVTGTIERDLFDKHSLARMMVGRDVALQVVRPKKEAGDAVLDVVGLVVSGDDGATAVRDATLQVRSGEVVAIAGVDGNGQQELVEALSGLRAVDAGTMAIAGHPYAHLDPRAFRAHGGGIIPGDRIRSGLALDLSVLENVLLDQSLVDRVVKRGVIDLAAARQYVRGIVAGYDIKAPNLDARLGSLSGGNQQKVIVARELEQRPALLIAAQPTRGVDIGACEFIYSLIMAFRQSGGAVLLVSTELEEVLSISDRVHVMVDGRLSASMATDELDLQQLGLLIGGSGGDHS